MRFNPKVLIGLGLLLVFGYFIYDLVLAQDQYIIRMRQQREAKNNSFRRAGSSPLSDELRQSFDSLKFYPPNRDYRLEAQLEQFPQRDTVEMPLTDGQADKYLRWGRAKFIFDKQEYQLTLFLKADGKDTTLFVPFTDRTNGFGSYGGGRYLDAPLPAASDTEVLLDFNQAYNPFCAYSDAYACPVPPPDNRLKLQIEAGEMAYK
ncbi:DUF1684 domain-containing protein [Hymenobacter aerophilus]|uniref:DUF1684 domain-containing protein n=1 Tax=Hymenobacter aerophilus TaxID=119644 RepID=UPI00036D2F36|nr:DUF1684 domain-containing protein [Hymenobacter aerophilus]